MGKTFIFDHPLMSVKLSIIRDEKTNTKEYANKIFTGTYKGLPAELRADENEAYSFYVNDEYAMSGVDTTTVEDGTSYMFKVEK